MSIGKDPRFGLDDFQKAKMDSPNIAVAESFKSLLFMRPGQLPSMPHVGINLHKYLYKFEEAVTADELLKEIHDQVRDLIPQIDADNIRIVMVPMSDGHEVMTIIAPLRGEATSIITAFRERDNKLIFKYSFDNNILK